MGKVSRRNFLKTGSLAAAGVGLLNGSAFKPDDLVKSIRIGVIGAGNRGARHISTLLTIEGAEITAVCDLVDSRTMNAASMCENAGRKRPSIYNGDENSYKEMLDKENLDAVIIATYWNSHAEIAVYAMKNAIYPAVEVPAALSVNDLWQLVDTSEKTGIPVMMLENACFRKDNLALLNMKRLGLFGEIVHCHGAHGHDLVDFWFYDRKNGEPNWAAEYLLKYNRDQFPTQSLAPLMSWMDINRGDIFTEIYSTASASKGINAFFKREFGVNHPAGNLHYNQGDVITSVLKTKAGKTVILNTDIQLPRPFANSWMLQGTKGIYNEEKDGVFLEFKSPEYHQWEPFKPYEEKYCHKWWQYDYSSKFNDGTDFVMLSQFVGAVRSKGPAPVDVYDSAVMSAVIELSGISIEKNSPVLFPDFTRGKWQTNSPRFAVE
jgi:hypothetical protein